MGNMETADKKVHYEAIDIIQNKLEKEIYE